MDGLQNCGCHAGAHIPDSIPYVDNQHVLALIEKRPEHRAEVKAALISMYNIFEYDFSTDPLVFLRQLRPAIVLLSDSSGWGEGFEILRRMRRDPQLHATPVVMFLSTDEPWREVSARESGAQGWLVRPYRRSALIRTISNQLNAQVEESWESLPILQARSLKGTVEIFNSLSDVIEKGEPIVYTDVRDACSPLVEAVNSDDYKGILNGVKHHDNYTYAHSMRVAIFLSLFGRTIGLTTEEQRTLAIGGLLHDVGKMYIPHLVLNKPGRLSDDEFALMKGHVDASIDILQAGGAIPQAIITIAAQHHEKLDGSGYPQGLKGTQLNRLARMASIVDIFGALTDRRVYKPSMSPELALSIMADEMSGQLDMGLLSTFRQMLLDATVGDVL